MISAQRPKILVVDDNKRNAALLEGYIKPHYDVAAAHTGEQCIEILGKERIDLVILDGVLPGVSGYDICKKIKSNEATKHVPIILIPAFPAGQEKIRSIQAGADDFISRPFGRSEIVARIGALLRMHEKRVELERANENISSLISNSAVIFRGFDPMKFSENEFYKSLLSLVLRKTHHDKDKPTHIFIGRKKGNTLKGEIYRHNAEHEACVIPEEFFTTGTSNISKDKHVSEIQYSNYTESDSVLEYQERFSPELKKAVGQIINFTSYISSFIAIIAFNYGCTVNVSDAQIIRSLAVHSPFFKTISKQMQEADDCFIYAVNVLARASEANGEDTGNHMSRVNQFSALIAKQLGLSEKFANDINVFAQLHDVGNIFVHPNILRKPEKLLDNEFETVKQHPVYGGRILGEHPRLKMAQNIALTHHERWDGSGYPYGLKGDIIPIEGRIATIADQYDTLRSPRVYKYGCSHVEACMIIAEGDDRTKPHHFDPQVMKAFKYVSSHMEEIYEGLKG